MNTLTDRRMRKDELVRVVSHELRTPLTSIQATVKLVMAGVVGPLTAEQTQLLGMALENVERMGRLLTDILDLGKLRDGRVSLRREQLDLGALLRRLAESFQPLAGQHKLTIAAEVPAQPLDIFVDRDKILQIFTNLIHNAIKFTPSGRITISAQDAGEEIECHVKDTGVGIAEKDLPRLFGEFQQFGHVAQTGEKGSGLGLALTRKLIELHGGTISVSSVEGQGTDFVIRLPRPGAAPLFSEDVRQRLILATAAGEALTLIRLQLVDWEKTAIALGSEASGAILRHFESVVQTSLRDPDDLVISTAPGQWVFGVNLSKVDSLRITDRIQDSFEKNSLTYMGSTPLVLEFQRVSFPDDARDPEHLLNILGIR